MSSHRKLRQRFEVATRPVHHRRLRRRPDLEVLEGRALLSTFTVNSLGGVGSGSGDSGDLRYCINLANADDQANTIVFDPTMFSTPQTITLSSGGQLELSDTGGTQTIAGPAAGVTISGGGNSRVFQIDSGVTASFSGLTISGGSVQGKGGGLANYGTATITDCTISGNTVTRFAFYGRYGQVYSADKGGGVFNSGTATLTDCTISGNTAFSIVRKARPGYDTYYYYNYYGNGGGVFNAGTAKLTDCTVSGNNAGAPGFSGGGLYNIGTANLILTDCTVSGNTGGGEENLGVTNVTLTDTIVAGNSGGDIAGYTNVSSSFNLIGTGGSGSMTNGVNGNIVLTSLTGLDLAPPGNFGGPTQTMALLPGSPALGAGVIADYPGTTTRITTDQRGEPLDTPNPDIGAFQSQDPTLTALSFSGISNQVITDGTSSVTISGTLADGSQAPVGETVAVTLDGVEQSPTIGSGGAFSTTFDTTSLTVANSPYTVNYVYLSDGTFASADTTSELTVNSATPTIFTVNSLGDAGSGSGDSGDLRYCINQANADDQANTIVFDPTLFSTPQTITLSGTGLFLEDTGGTQTITGPAAGLTIKSGGNSRVFQIDDGVTASISGLTISGGTVQWPGSGGGLKNYGTATLTDCTISGNSANIGGGVYNGSYANLTLTDCTVSDNSARSWGGGLFNDGFATLTDCTLSGNSSGGAGGGVFNTGVEYEMGVFPKLTLTDCTIGGNSAGGGGGGVFNDATATLTDCTVSDNSSGSTGGGVFNKGPANLTLTGCTVSGNTGVRAGGVGNYAGTSTLIDCTVGGNYAAYGGGAFNYYQEATLILIDCTVSGNNATDSGGGVFSYGTVNLTDTILAGNTSGSSASDIVGNVSGSFNLIGTGGSGGLVNGVDGNIVLTSLSGLGLAPLAKNGGPTQTIALLRGSPAIAAGVIADYPGTTTPITTDQRGEPLDSPYPDMGAFQVQGSGLIALSFSGLSNPSITYGTPSVTISGTLSSGSRAPVGESVAVTLDGVQQSANIGTGGAFSTTFDTTGLTIANSPYTVSYVYTSDGTFAPARTTSELTVTPPIFTVNSLGDAGIGSGDSGDLRYCINQANADDEANTIVFDPTLFSTPQTITLSGGQLSLEDTGGTQTITGPATGVTISGGGNSRVFQVEPGVTASFSGLTISDGAVVHAGAGLENYGTATLTDCTISGNSLPASDPYGAPSDGAAVFNGQTFPNYYGTRYGTGNLTLIDCTISGNSSGGSGGGVFNSGTAYIYGCTLSDNYGASNSGGLFNIGTANLADCTLSGNSAGFNGGGLGNYGGWSTLVNCTISGNSSTIVSVRAGGSYGYNGGVYNWSGAVNLTDTIVAGNTNSVGASADIAGPGNVSGRYNLIGPGGSGGLVNGVYGNIVLTSLTGLGLAPLGNYGGPTQTMALLPGSPAIGAGVIAGYPGNFMTPITTDQRGLPLDSPNPDIGAFQNQGSPLLGLTFSVSNQSINYGTPSVTISGTLTDGARAPVGETVAVTLDGVEHSATIGPGGAFSTTLDTAGLTVPDSPYTIIYAYTTDGTFAAESTTSKLTVNPTLITLTVDSLGDAGIGSGDAGDLRYCIDQANADDVPNTIVFDPTVFSTPQTITLSGGPLELSDTAGTQTITGPAAGLTLSGGGSSRVFQVDSGVTASITGLTISGGSAAGLGGGLANYGTATLTDCTLSGNTCFNSRGGYCDGGAVFNGQTAPNYDGVRYGAANLTLTDCTLSGNDATYGGGVFNSGTANLTDCTLSDNDATYGGGVLNVSGTANLTDCTVSGNSAVGLGGGLANYGYAQTAVGPANLTDTIVAGNTDPSGASDIAGGDVSGSFNLIGTGGSGGLVNGVNGNIVLTSLTGLGLAPLGNNGGPTQTMALLPGSPAIGAGVIADYPGTTTPITTDQRGEPLDSPNPDIGAYQTQGSTLTSLSFSGISNQSITYGTSSVTVSGTLAGASQTPVGETVAVTLDHVQQSATIGSGGAFSTTFNADGLTVSKSPDTITYAYAGDRTFASASTTSTLTVNPATLTITANPETKVYGTADPALAYTASGFQFHDTADSVLTGALARAQAGTLAGEQAGGYTIGQGTLAADSNYTITFTGSTLTITPAPLTVAANPQTKVYGTEDPALTDTATGFVDTTVDGVTIDDTAATALSGQLARTPGETISGGPYAITQGTLAADSDYTIAFTGTTLTITPAPLAVTANPQTKVYGASDPSLTDSVTGLVDTTVEGVTIDDTAASVLTGHLVRASGETVAGGPYAVTLGTLAADSNYAISFTGNTLTITPAPLTVAANSQTKVYGTGDPSLTDSVTGLVDTTVDGVTIDDTAASVLTGHLVRASGETVDGGPYAITLGTLAADSNYTLSFTGSTLTITPATLTVTANPQTKVYGTADPALTVTPAGLVDVTVDGVTIDDTPATVLTGSPARAQGGTIAGEQVGHYAITQGTLAADSNYTLSFTASTLTITPATLTVTANPQTKVYGTADPALTDTATGFVDTTVDGVTIDDTAATVLTGQLSRTPGQTVSSGPYAITQGTLAADSNYTLSFTGSALTITPATLTIAAKPETKVFGSADPALAFTAAGFQLGDTAATVLSGHLSRAAGQTVAGGPYAITQGTLAADANYTIQFTASTLAITPATPLVSESAAGGTYTGAPIAATALVTGVGSTATPNLEDVTPTLTYFAGSSTSGTNLGSTAPSAAGTYTVVARFPGSADYAAAQSKPATFTITPATTTIVLEPHAVLTRKKVLKGVELTAAIQPMTPGGGVPTGTVTFEFLTKHGKKVKATTLGTAALSGGAATLTFKPDKVLNKTLTIVYSGAPDFLASTMSPTKLTKSEVANSRI